MPVQIRWQGRKMAVPLSQLAIDADESTDEVIGDWHYWVGGLGYFLSFTHVCSPKWMRKRRSSTRINPNSLDLL
jgi:hypothetical protein